MSITIVQTGGYLVAGKYYVTASYFARAEQLGIITLKWFVQTKTGNARLSDLSFTVAQTLTSYFQTVTTTGTTILGTKTNSLAVSPPDLPGIATDGGTGAVTEPAQAGQVSGIISWQTINAGRAWRGRNYVPFPAVSAIADNGYPTTVYVGYLQALANAILGITSLTCVSGSASVNLTLWHRALVSGTTIISGQGKGMFATQKRRGNYGRINAPFIPG